MEDLTDNQCDETEHSHVESFEWHDKELKITYSDRKYTIVKLTQTETNALDIDITKGDDQARKPVVISCIRSQNIRRENMATANFSMAVVLTALLVMSVFVICVVSINASKELNLNAKINHVNSSLINNKELL